MSSLIPDFIHSNIVGMQTRQFALLKECEPEVRGTINRLKISPWLADGSQYKQKSPEYRGSK
ncbi:MAG: hypothetical protein KAW56_10790 [Candidatus Marinimicrobia bacterium]|nr:hypothetical protein [Candidatus Neomarinimicrobiota bacterium]MCK4447553.1 hypothetical protein [Candidatus Neomarinimicrobiota bacterium]